MRRLLKTLVILGVIAVVVAVVKSLLESRRSALTPSPAPGSPEPHPSPAPAPAPAEKAPAPASAPWVEPAADGSCPDGYPVKATKTSKIFHVPGGASYDRTTPDRCYASPAAAEADGLRQAKR